MKKQIKKLSENNLVVQSNSLIESSYTLSVSEQKIILSVVSMINPGDADFAPYTFRITDFMALAGIEDQTAYKRIRDFSKGLLEKVIEIRSPKSVLYVNWFSSVKYYDGHVEIKVSPELKPYYLGLKEKFTQYQIKHIMQLKSFYSIRVYELLKQYEKLNDRTFELSKLKTLLGVKGKTYSLYANFKNKVIKVAQEELTEKADLTFTFEEIKRRKKVEQIKFSIFKNNGKDRKYFSNSTEKITISEIVLRAIPEKQYCNLVLKLIESYLKKGVSEEYILSNIRYTEKHAKTNFPLYFKKALFNDYAKDERELAIKEREIAEKQKKLLEEAERIAQEREKLEQEKKQREDEQIFGVISQLPEHHYKEIEKQAAINLKNFPPPKNATPDIFSKWQRTYMVDVYKMLNKLGKL